MFAFLLKKTVESLFAAGQSAAAVAAAVAVTAISGRYTGVHHLKLQVTLTMAVSYFAEVHQPRMVYFSAVLLKTV